MGENRQFSAISQLDLENYSAQQLRGIGPIHNKITQAQAALIVLHTCVLWWLICQITYISRCNLFTNNVFSNLNLFVNNMFGVLR